MTQTPLQTHSLFDDLLDQQQTSSPAPTEVAAVDEAAQDATFDQATSDTAPPADEPSVHQAESTQTDYKSDALAMAEFIEFDGKFMHVTDPDLVTSKVQRHKLSPSTASALLDNCPASWAFEKLLPFDDSPFSPAGAGGLAHEALESFYELPPKQRDGVALSEEISKVVHKTFPHDAAKSALLSQKLNHLAGGVFDLEDPMDIHVDRVEEKIEETIDGIPVTGTVDRTELIDGGDVWIGDYKTGKAREKKYRGNYERAMRVYTLLKEAQTGQRPAGASLLYTADKQEFDVSVTERDLDKTRRDLRKAWDLHNTCVEDSAFPTKTGPLCGWCPLANICTAAQDDGFGPSLKAIDAGIEFIPAPEVDDGQDTSDAGHCEDSTENTSDDTDISTPQKETMTTRPLIEEPSPFAMLTDSGELNPPSGAATSLFGLYSRIDEAIRTSHPDFDRDRQRELTTLTLNDVVEVLVQSATAWIGTDASPQDGAFTRLTQVADTHIAREQCDFDDEDSVNSWLDDLASELGFAVGAVLDVFDAYLPAED